MPLFQSRIVTEDTMRTILRLKIRPLPSGRLLAALLLVTLIAPTASLAQTLAVLDSSVRNSRGHDDGDAWLPLSSLRVEPALELVRPPVQPAAPSWKVEAHQILFEHQKAWVLPTLIHAATPGVMLLSGILDQARKNPDCFDCGEEANYAGSLAFYFHASSVIAGGVTWITLGDLHARISFENDQARLADRLQQTSKGFGVAAIISGSLAAVCVGAIIAANTSAEPGNNPLYDMRGLFVMGWIQNGLAAPIFAHIAITNAIVADQIANIGEDSAYANPSAMRQQPMRPRLLGASPFGFSLAF